MRISLLLRVTLVALISTHGGVGFVTSPAFAQDGTEVSHDAKRGKVLFLQCRACHTLKQGEPHRVGPNLHGLFDKKAAFADGFAYSDVLKAAQLVWTTETLDHWLEKPAHLVPGNKMAYAGMKAKADRDILIRYLKEETK